jgi:hypothetical protein
MEYKLPVTLESCIKHVGAMWQCGLTVEMVQVVEETHEYIERQMQIHGDKS